MPITYGGFKNTEQGAKQFLMQTIRIVFDCNAQLGWHYYSNSPATLGLSSPDLQNTVRGAITLLSRQHAYRYAANITDYDAYKKLYPTIEHISNVFAQSNLATFVLERPDCFAYRTTYRIHSQHGLPVPNVASYAWYFLYDGRASISEREKELFLQTHNEYPTFNHVAEKLRSLGCQVIPLTSACPRHEHTDRLLRHHILLANGARYEEIQDGVLRDLLNFCRQVYQSRV